MQILTPPRPRERIGFVVPRWTTDHAWHDRQGTPFRAMPVAGALYNRGYEVAWFDQELDLDRADRSAEMHAALAGARVLFVWTNELWPLTQLQNIQRIVRAVRGWYPGIRVVVGGAFPTVCPAEMLFVDGLADCFLRGYGEDVAPAFMEALDDERRLAAVPGLVWRDAGGWRANPIAEHTRFAAEDNDVVYRLLDMAPYVQRGGIFGNGRETLVVGTGRGCGKGCGFCFWRNNEPALLKAEAIVDLVEHLREVYGVRQYHLAELDFFTNRHRALELAKRWAERLGDCIWFSLVSPVDARKFSADDWDLIARGGCAKLELGTESGSPAVLAAIGKRHRPEESIALNQLLLERGIAPMHNFIFGFDGETADDRRLSFRLIEALLRQGPERVTFAIRLFQATPHTPMGDRALALAGADFPATIDELGSYRPLYSDGSARMMPWLPERDESAIKKVTAHYLPLAISRLPYRSAWQRTLYAGLRRLAWLRLHRHAFGWNADARLFDRVLRQTLSLTYRP